MRFSRQAYWSGLLCPPSGDLPDPGVKPRPLMSTLLAGTFFTSSGNGDPLSRSIMFDLLWPTDCGQLGSPVYGISQARILEWVAISFSMDLPDLGTVPVSPAWQADSLGKEKCPKADKCTRKNLLIFYYKIKKCFSCRLDLETSKMSVLEGAMRVNLILYWNITG